MAELAPLDPVTQEIPDKLYFRIGEVSKLTGVKQYVLRFWESEFPGLGPKKSGTGHRLYRRKDVEVVLEIKGSAFTKSDTPLRARASGSRREQSRNRPQRRREPRLRR